MSESSTGVWDKT